jgi:hypothetical protein
MTKAATAPNGKPYAYLLTSTEGVCYYLAENGDVIDRSDGPRGWDYKGGWRILGITRRYHSAPFRMVSLADAANGADVGHGIVHDLDHGTHRVWGSRRLASVRRA